MTGRNRERQGGGKQGEQEKEENLIKEPFAWARAAKGEKFTDLGITYSCLDMTLSCSVSHIFETVAFR